MVQWVGRRQLGGPGDKQFVVSSRIVTGTVRPASYTPESDHLQTPAASTRVTSAMAVVPAKAAAAAKSQAAAKFQVTQRLKLLPRPKLLPRGSLLPLLMSHQGTPPDVLVAALFLPSKRVSKRQPLPPPPTPWSLGIHVVVRFMHSFLKQVCMVPRAALLLPPARGI